MADLPQLLKRLEAVTVRLEDIAAGTKNSAAANGHANISTSGGAEGKNSPMLEGFDEIVNGPVTKFLTLSAGIGGLVQEQALLVKQVFGEQRGLLQTALGHKKPDAATLQTLLKPMADGLGKIGELKEKNRASPLFNHLSAVAEGMPALGWVAVEPKPAPFVGEMKDAAQFYVNRILKEFKDKDKSHVEWAQSFSAALLDLQAFVKKFHTTGLVWSPTGADPKTASISASVPPHTATAATPTTTASTAQKPAGPGLFAELNKGGEITSGLKKVDKSQMTHKNPALRASSVVKAEDKSPAPGTAKAPTSTVQARPAKLALEGNKWYIENHDNNKTIVLDQVDMKQGAYIYGCTNSTIQIKGKIGAVTIDSCKKTAIVLEHVLSALEVVNCKAVQLQILGKAPTAVIDKTDGLQVYLSKECVDIEVFTAKSSEVNVSIPPLKEGEDFIEKAVPEQLKSVVVNGTLVTSIVEHKG